MAAQPAKKTTKATAKTAKSAATYTGFDEGERAAMKDRADELKKTARRGAKADFEPDVLAKIAEMVDADRVIAERIHEIVKTAAPELKPKLWYGMPAYQTAAGKNVCFFTPAAKFKTRYASLGFEEAANLDDGNMWPTAFALTELTTADEKKIAALLKKAVG